MRVRLYAVTFMVAVPVNFVWEMVQAAWFAPMGGWAEATSRCAAASLGDGLVVMVIAAIGGLLFRRADWFARPGVAGHVFMATLGFAIAVLIERRGLASGRWAYTGGMPLIPVVNVGFVPILQMVVLPPLAFAIAVGRVRAAGERG